MALDEYVQQEVGCLQIIPQSNSQSGLQKFEMRGVLALHIGIEPASSRQLGFSEVSAKSFSPAHGTGRFKREGRVHGTWAIVLKAVEPLENQPEPC